MKNDHIPSRQIDGVGVISGDLFLDLPCRLYSLTGKFYRIINDEEELLQFLKDHRNTPGAFFDVSEIFAYYNEKKGDVIYSASDFHIRSKFDDKARVMIYPQMAGLY